VEVWWLEKNIKNHLLVFLEDLCTYNVVVFSLLEFACTGVSTCEKRATIFFDDETTSGGVVFVVVVVVVDDDDNDDEKDEAIYSSGPHRSIVVPFFLLLQSFVVRCNAHPAQSPRRIETTHANFSSALESSLV